VLRPTEAEEAGAAAAGVSELEEEKEEEEERKQEATKGKETGLLKFNIPQCENVQHILVL
jgi:hypothetical protein